MSAFSVPPDMSSLADARIQFKRGIFFDNEQSNIDNMRRYFDHTIESVKVADTEGFKKDERSKLNDDYVRMVMADGIPNKYIQILEKMSGDVFDEKSGMTDKDIETCMAWCADSTIDTPKVAMFDWDRTLTRSEGFETVGSLASTIVAVKESYGLTMTKDELAIDMLFYLFGGQDRISKLNAMFTACKENNVAIYILTNNLIAKQLIFGELLDKFIGPGEYKLHYTGQDIDGKGHFLSMLPEFRQMNEINLDYQYQSSKSANMVMQKNPKQNRKNLKQTRNAKLGLKILNELYGMDGGSPKRKRTKRMKSKRKRTKNYKK